MADYSILRSEDRLTLRITPMAVIGRFGQFILRGVINIIRFVVTLDVPEIVFTDLLEGGKIVMDRKKNELAIDGRRVCRLDKVSLEIRNEWKPFFLPRRLHTRNLVLRFPSRHYRGVLSYQKIELGEYPIDESEEIAELTMALSATLTIDKELDRAG